MGVRLDVLVGYHWRMDDHVNWFHMKWYFVSLMIEPWFFVSAGFSHRHDYDGL